MNWNGSIAVSATLLAGAIAGCGGRIQIENDSVDSGFDSSRPTSGSAGAAIATSGGTGGATGSNTTGGSATGGATGSGATGGATGGGTTGGGAAGGAAGRGATGGSGGSSGGPPFRPEGGIAGAAPPPPDGGRGGSPPFPEGGPLPERESGAPAPPPDGGDGCALMLSLVNVQSWIAFDSDSDNFQRNIYMIHPDRTGMTQLTKGSNLDKEPAFSPSGAELTFTSDRAGGLQIFMMDLATRMPRQLTRRAEGADQSSFSRDGKMVAFHSGPSVYVIGIDGTGERLVATGLDNFNAYFWPQFSADGTELVFDRNNEINAARLDGVGLRQIVQNWTTTIKAPAISASGTEVAYSVWCDGLSVWTSPFTTTTEPCKGRRVTPLDGYDAGRPTWGSNSVIAYERVNKSTNLATITAISRSANSPPCVLTSTSADSRNPSWSW
jgi:hypothetical protein